MQTYLFDVHNKYVFVPGDRGPNNITLIRYYIETLIKELGLDSCSTPTGNSTYALCQMSFQQVSWYWLSDDDKILPYLYWTPKLHKSLMKHHFLAGFSKCTTKQLSILLITKILTFIKTILQYKNQPHWS